MIFDDHDIRDDWNTSLSWKEEMEATSWWHGRIVAGLASYWVYQHVGNLSPPERAEDAIWRRITAARGDDELDLGPVLDGLADRADQRPDSYRWSYAGTSGSRLVVVDSRAARKLVPGGRALLDQAEMDWFDGRMRGDVRHLLVGHVAAVPAAAGAALPGGVERSRRRPERGGSGRPGTASGCARPSTWSTGAPSRRPSTPSLRWPSRSRTASGAGLRRR